MIERVTYERLFNLGGYENLRLAATAIVEATVEAAFSEAKQAVEGQHAQFLAEKAETRRREQEQYEAGVARRRAEYEAERKTIAERDALLLADDMEDERDERGGEFDDERDDDDLML